MQYEEFEDVFLDRTYIKKLILPSSAYMFSQTDLQIEQIEVEGGDDSLLMVEGNALINRRSKELVLLFGNISTDYSIPDSVRVLSNITLLTTYDRFNSKY